MEIFLREIMSSLKTQQFLLKVANFYLNERATLPKADLLRKINEIKYLSAQKKVPKLTLRKEVIQLEHQLQRVFQIEEKINLKEKQESVKVTSLKRQLSQLRNRLVMAEDRDLQRKVEKLSSLLGECLAKNNSAEQATLQEHVLAEQPEDKESHLQLLQQRLAALKEQLDVREDLSLQARQQLEAKIELLEEKLQQLHSEIQEHEAASEVIPEKEEVKHTLIFHPPPPQRKD